MANKLDLSSKGLTEWPAAEIDKAGPANIGDLQLNENKLVAINVGLSGLAPLANLKTLNLYKNQLTALPPEIGQLAALEDLNVASNKLTVIPPEIGRLSRLREFSAYGNEITSVPPEIGQLSALKKLLLYANQLTALPQEMMYLLALEYIDIETNKLTNTWMFELARLPKLSTLIAGKNPYANGAPSISQLRDEWMKKVWNASEGALTLKGLKLTKWPTFEIEKAGPANVRVLDLSENELTFIPGAELAKLTAVTNLYMYSNKLVGSLPREIGDMSALEYLNVQNNQLTDLPIRLRRLPKLSAVYFGKNPLTGIPESARPGDEYAPLVYLRSLPYHDPE